MSRVLFLAALLLALAVPASAQDASSRNVEARLIAENETVAPGQTVTVALEEIIRPGWHTYWVNPGDAGAPTIIKWTLPQGWQASDIQWPTPKRIPVAHLMDYGYEDKVWLLTDIALPADAKPGETITLKADASWLVCKEVCVPEDVSLSLDVRVGVAPSAPARAADFAEARAKLPVPSPWKLSYAVGKSLDLFVAAPELATARPVDAVFFPINAGAVRGSSSQQLGFAESGAVLRLVPGSRVADLKGGALNGVLVLTSVDSSVQALQVSALPGAVPAADFSQGVELGLWLALISAFVGGLILNVMPCVLPVLALKAFALARTEPHRARVEGIAYASGAILSFAALGLVIVLLQQSGAILGWGFQLQEPLVVAGFALLMFAIGLNLAGVFALEPVAAGGSLAGKQGTTGAFFTGVLAVAIAAPCTAPFMAGALGYALTQTAPMALAIFVALGLGFAAPFLLLSLWPAAIRALPKPGAWMVRLKQILAIPMFATAVWLAWVLAQQTGVKGVWMLLGAMLALAIGAVIWTATRGLDARGRNIGALATLVALLVALSGLYLMHTSAVSPAALERADAYTPDRLQALRAEQRPVFINATAAWCITCLVNEQVVLSRPSVRASFERSNVAVLIADWTNRDAAVTQLLRSQQRSGVPLYLYYAPGRAAPMILPQILTEDSINAALAQ